MSCDIVSLLARLHWCDGMPHGNFNSPVVQEWGDGEVGGLQPQGTATRKYSANALEPCIPVTGNHEARPKHANTASMSAGLASTAHGGALGGTACLGEVRPHSHFSLLPCSESGQTRAHAFMRVRACPRGCSLAVSPCTCADTCACCDASTSAGAAAHASVLELA